MTFRYRSSLQFWVVTVYTRLIRTAPNRSTVSRQFFFKYCLFFWSETPRVSPRGVSLFDFNQQHDDSLIRWNGIKESERIYSHLVGVDMSDPGIDFQRALAPCDHIV